MAQNYLREVSADRKWDIMCAVINCDGVDDEKIIQMVQDGYPVSIILFELLYRLGRKDLIKQLIAYDEGLYDECYVRSSKMLLLEKAFGKEEAHKIRQELVVAHQKELEERKKKIKEEKLDQLVKLYNSVGLCDKFYEKLMSMSLASTALELYAQNEKMKKQIMMGISKSLAGQHFLAQNVSVSDLIHYGMYAFALKLLWACSENKREELLQIMAETDEGLEVILDNFTYTKSICIDEDLKARIKKFGRKGYLFLLNHKDLTEKDFEEYCKIYPQVSRLYSEYNKTIFWIMKNGYLKYIW